MFARLVAVSVVALTAAFSAQAAQTSAPDTGTPNASAFAQICESSGLRAMERADCRAQMKAATSDQQRRDIFRSFDIRANGTETQQG